MLSETENSFQIYLIDVQIIDDIVWQVQIEWSFNESVIFQFMDPVGSDDALIVKFMLI